MSNLGPVTSRLKLPEQPAGDLLLILLVPNRTLCMSAWAPQRRSTSPVWGLSRSPPPEPRERLDWPGSRQCWPCDWSQSAACVDSGRLRSSPGRRRRSAPRCTERGQWGERTSPRQQWLRNRMAGWQILGPKVMLHVTTLVWVVFATKPCRTLESELVLRGTSLYQIQQCRFKQIT